jgi:carboxyl-terminal processing protease
MPKRNIFVLLMMIAVAGVSWLARDRAGHGRRFAEVLGSIERSSLDPVDQQGLFDAAMQGVFSRLDEHSAFVAGDQPDRLKNLLDQECGGVGLELDGSDLRQGIVVASPVLGAPAWHAGMAAGDRILAIDGVTTARMTMEEVFQRLRGRPGTAVLLSVEAAGDPVEQDAPAAVARDISLLREVIKTESVVGDRRRPDGSWEWTIEGESAVAMIRIKTFGERTAEEVRRAVEAIESRLTNAESDGDSDERPKAALVLDLRGNAGGLLSAAVEVCDIFLDDGVIVSTKGRGVHDAGAAGDAAAALDVQRATRGAALADLPMAVLVDGLTASAAEVVAACLQDHGRAIVVGSRSFGKGTEQSIIRLSDGSGFLKLTTSEYLRPSRGTIHRRSNDDGDSTWGVRPDGGCEITPTGRQIESFQAWRHIRDVVPAKGSLPETLQSPSQAVLPRRVDPVLAKAVDVLRERD